MSLNFNFLKGANRNLYRLAKEIEDNRIASSEAAIYMGSTFLDNLVYDIYKRTNQPITNIKSIDRVNELSSNGFISYELADQIVKGFQVRNEIHNRIDSIEQYFIINKINANRIYRHIFRASLMYYQEFFDSNYTQPFNNPESMKDAFVNYERCPICGKKTNKNSLLCLDCEDEIELFDNLTEIIETVGIENNFRKDQIIGVNFYSAEVEALTINLRNKRLISKNGIFFNFNREAIGEFCKKIAEYKEIRDLILDIETKNINPAEIRKTETFIKGSEGREPFVTFHKLIFNQLSDSFAESLEYCDYVKTIESKRIFTPEEFIPWCKNNMDNENLFTQLKQHYLEAKKQCKSDDCIKEIMYIDDAILNFIADKQVVKDALFEIKKEKYLNALAKYKTFSEALEAANLTQRQIDEIRKVDIGFRKGIDAQIERRKERFLTELKSNGLRDAFAKSKLEAKHLEGEAERILKSEFYRKLMCLLQEKFLSNRQSGKTERESIEICQIDDEIYNKWIINPKFKSKLDSTELNLLFDSLKNEIALKEALKLANVSKKEFNRLIVDAYENENDDIIQLYEDNVLYNEFDSFLKAFHNSHNEKDALHSSKYDKKILDIVLERYGEIAKMYDEFRECKSCSDSLKNIGNAGEMEELTLDNVKFKGRIHNDFEEAAKDDSVILGYKKNAPSILSVEKLGMPVKSICDLSDEEVDSFVKDFKANSIKRPVRKVQDEDLIEVAEYMGVNPTDFLADNRKITKKAEKCFKMALFDTKSLI